MKPILRPLRLRHVWAVVTILLTITTLVASELGDVTTRPIAGGIVVVNVAGRQRALSQRIALTALRYATSEGATRKRMRSQLESDIARMRSTHALLLSGAANAGLSNTMTKRVRDIYYAGPQLDLQVGAFLREAEELLEIPESELSEDDAHVAYLVNASASDLLSALDAATQQYQDDGLSRIEWMQGAGRALAAIGLAIIVLLGFFLIRPTLARAERERTELADAERKLRMILANAPLVLFSIDAEGNLTTSEGPASAALSAQRRQKTNIRERYADHPEILAAIDRARTGETVAITSKVDGAVFEVRFAPNRTEHSAAGEVIGVSLDVTARHLAEEEQHRAHAEAHRRGTRIAVITRMLGVLNTCEGIEEARAVLPAFLNELFPESAVGVKAISRSRRIVEPLATSNADGSGSFTPDECWALRAGRSHRSKIGAGALRCRHLAHRPGEFLCIPMMARGEALGVLVVDDQTSGQSDKQALAEELAEHLALGLANLTLRESLRNLSIQDSLTGLFNRRYLEETLEREIRRADRSGQPLSVVMVDLDHFKALNDRHGHQAGDEALRVIGRLLRGAVGEEDVVCRYGGEEFIIVFPNTDASEAVQRAEGIRLRVRQQSLMYRDQPLGLLSASFGVASFPKFGKSVGQVLRAADRAVYAAKRAGRDTVRIDESPTPLLESEYPAASH